MNKSLHDIIEEDLKKGMSNAEIIKHVQSMSKYSDMSYFTISDVIKSIKIELNLL